MRGTVWEKHNLAHHKIEDPLRGSTGCDADLANAGGEDLAEVEPERCESLR